MHIHLDDQIERSILVYECKSPVGFFICFHLIIHWNSFAVSIGLSCFSCKVQFLLFGIAHIGIPHTSNQANNVFFCGWYLVLDLKPHLRTSFEWYVFTCSGTGHKSMHLATCSNLFLCVCSANANFRFGIERAFCKIGFANELTWMKAHTFVDSFSIWRIFLIKYLASIEKPEYWS